jgi:predicted dehydrogenase/nucleoside-diphosphate-sugar epimerase
MPDTSNNPPPQPSARSVIVTGAGGYLGSAIRNALTRHGWEVFAMSRATGPGLIDYDRLGEVLPRARALVHCAAVTQWFDDSGQIRKINEDWPVELYQLAAKASLEAMVFLSSLAGGGLWPIRGALTETPLVDLRPGRMSDYALSKAAAERRLMKQSGPTRLVILRTGLVYDAQRWPIRRPQHPVESPDQRLPLVHRDNVCRSVAGVLTDERASGIYHLVDPHQPYTRQLCRRLGVEIGRTGPVKRRLLPPARWVKAIFGSHLHPIRKARWATDLARRNRTYCAAGLAGLGLAPAATPANQLPDPPTSPPSGPLPPMRTALIGAGRWARVLAARWAPSRSLQFRGVCDPNVQSGDLPRGLAGLALHADLQDLLRADHYDAAILCTPNHLHADQIEQLAGQVPALYVEKPLVSSGSQLERVRQAAEASGCFILAGHGLSRSTTGRAIANWLGKAGRVRKARLVRSLRADYPADDWRCDPAKCPGGVLAQLGIHLLDLAVANLGELEIVCVSPHRRGDGGQIWSASLRARAGDAAIEMYTALADRDRLEVHIEADHGALLATQHKLWWNLRGQTHSRSACWQDAPDALLARLHRAWWDLRGGLDPHSLAVARAFDQVLQRAGHLPSRTPDSPRRLQPTRERIGA